MVLHRFADEAAGNTEHETLAGQGTQGPDHARGRARLALGQQADTGAETDARGHRGTGREGDERVIEPGEAFDAFECPPRAGPRHGHVAVLGQVETVDAAYLGFARGTLRRQCVTVVGQADGNAGARVQRGRRGVCRHGTGDGIHDDARTRSRVPRIHVRTRGPIGTGVNCFTFSRAVPMTPRSPACTAA